MYRKPSFIAAVKGSDQNIGLPVPYGFSQWLRGKESTCNPRPLGQEDLLEEEMATHSGILAMDREAWQAIVHAVKESDVVEQAGASSPQIKKAFVP